MNDYRSFTVTHCDYDDESGCYSGEAILPSGTGFVTFVGADLTKAEYEFHVSVDVYWEWVGERYV